MTSQFDNLVTIYQQRIDALINDLGKRMELHFEDTVETIADVSRDKVHGGSAVPKFKSTAPETTKNTVTIVALVAWNPKDAATYGINVSSEKPVVRLKTFLTHAPNLKRAKFMVPNIDSAQYVGKKFQMVRAPIPLGLSEDRYCVSYWQAI